MHLARCRGAVRRPAPAARGLPLDAGERPEAARADRRPLLADRRRPGQHHGEQHVQPAVARQPRHHLERGEVLLPRLDVLLPRHARAARRVEVFLSRCAHAS